MRCPPTLSRLELKNQNTRDILLTTLSKLCIPLRLNHLQYASRVFNVLFVMGDLLFNVDCGIKQSSSKIPRFHKSSLHTCIEFISCIYINI